MGLDIGSIGLPTLLGMLTMRAVKQNQEFEADKEGARFAGKENMIKSLTMLEQANGVGQPSITQKQRIYQFFSSHPSTEKRIRRLKKMDEDRQR